MSTGSITIDKDTGTEVFIYSKSDDDIVLALSQGQEYLEITIKPHHLFLIESLSSDVLDGYINEVEQ